MKKKGYYEYGNGIYPLKLWVHIGKDLKELIDYCFDGCKAPDSDYGGVTYADAIRKSDRRRGVLVSFQCQKDMSMNYCCHEASHVCDAIEDYTDMEHGDEPSAYLIGWIASCINKAVWVLVILLKLKIRRNSLCILDLETVAALMC